MRTLQTDTHTWRFDLEGAAYTLPTCPEYPYWDRVSPSSALAAKYVEAAPGERTLLIGGEQGALAQHLAQKCAPGELWVMEDNTLAMEMIAAGLARQNLSQARVHDRIELPPGTDGRFDRAVILCRRGRELARRQIRIAHQALREGGILSLAGDKRAGIQPVLNDAAELFGAVSVLGYKKGHRIGACKKEAQGARVPDWLAEEGIRRGTRRTIELDLPGGRFTLASLPGVFSYKHLDEGTALLLDNSGEVTGMRVLDLGCGYGVLGLHAARNEAAQVDLVDISLAALTCARENLERHHVSNGRALSAAEFEREEVEPYDLVLMNPPFHSGKEVNYNLPESLIRRAHAALRRGGRLILVANRFIRYERQMSELFRRAEITAQTGKFHIICGTK